MNRTALLRRAPLLRKLPLRRTPMRAQRSQAARDYKAELDAQRPRVESRSRGRCEARLPGCKTWANHVHHRQQRSAGGGNGLGNLLAVCGGGLRGGCHETIHANPSLAYQCGLLVPSWRDPEDVAVRVGINDLWEAAS